MAVLAGILGLMFLVLTMRLAYLQFIQTEKYQVLAQNNLVRVISIAAPRGEIRDRQGELLVDNKPVYTLSLSFLGVSEQKQDRVKRLLAEILSRDKNVAKSPAAWHSEIEARLAQQVRPFEPVKVAVDVTWETVVQVRERQAELPGVIVEEEPVRNYPHGELLAHVLGFVREMNESQLKLHQDEGYRMGDKYGQDGLENSFESYLRGEKGARQVEVDASGRPVAARGVKKPVSGSDLILTIDYRLQKATEQALVEGIKRARKKGYEEAKAGAAVVMNVRTGEVLAMASYPTYDPAIFADRLSDEEWQKINQAGALVNRALRLYPPGSVFKMVTAAAILENEIVDPEHRIKDPGYYMLGRTRFNDWKPGGHGRVDMRKALQVSCDTYFWKYGRAAGHREIARFAREFGLGQKTGIELPGERAGVVPTPEYKRENVKAYLMLYNEEFIQLEKKYERLLQEAENEQQRKKLRQEREEKLNALLDKYDWHLNWQTYDTLNMAIGQGDNWYTPLQLARYVSAIANGGILLKPYIVQKIIGPDGKVQKSFSTVVQGKVNISAENLKILQEGMHLVTLPPVGTACGVFAGFPLSAAAKTGTAEVAGHDNHALFAAYVPFEEPEIAVVAVVEYGGSGSGVAGPVVRDILDEYVKITRGWEEGKEEKATAQQRGHEERDDAYSPANEEQPGERTLENNEQPEASRPAGPTQAGETPAEDESNQQTLLSPGTGSGTATSQPAGTRQANQPSEVDESNQQALPPLNTNTGDENNAGESISEND